MAQFSFTKPSPLRTMYNTAITAHTDVVAAQVEAANIAAANAGMMWVDVQATEVVITWLRNQGFTVTRLNSGLVRVSWAPP